MSYKIRPATLDDAAELLAIYAPYVSGTTISFELEVPSVSEFAERIRLKSDHYSYIVAEDADDGSLAGYAYCDTLRSRPAYQWAAEISIYLSSAHQGKGLGRRLLTALERLMAAQGIVLSVACITSSNDSSIAFHRKMGYTVCGEFHDCAFKLGTWLGITWMEKKLLPCSGAPEPLAPLPHEVRDRILLDA